MTNIHWTLFHTSALVGIINRVLYIGKLEAQRH